MPHQAHMEGERIAVTNDRDELHELVDRLREEDTEEARRALERLVERQGHQDASSGVEFDGLSEEEIDAVLAGSAPSGNPVDEEDIDRVLYDEAQE